MFVGRNRAIMRVMGSTLRGRASAAALAAALIGLPMSVPALADGIALPTGGQVVAGSASIGSGLGGLTVNQTSARAIIDWKSFSIGAGGSVAFNNGTGATLNRVTGGDLSTIAGQLSATGSVYLINPAGIVVDSSGKVLTGGSFVASTRMVDMASFMSAGNLTFSGDSAGGVENFGSISAGGDVVMIGAMAGNSGTISAGGTVGLAAADRIVLQASGQDQRIMVDGGAGDVTNTGTITSAAAELRAAGGNVYALAGNNGGIVSATGGAAQNGRVWLDAGGDVTVSGAVTAKNADGSGGTVHVVGTNISLKDGANIDASGTKGGTVLVGGDFQGGNGDKTFADAPIRHATFVGMDRGASINVDGQGAGGTAVLWSDEYTGFAGTISAKGGASGGDGGLVETSSHNILDFLGSADTSAVNGSVGTLLLDPTNITISTGADATTGGTTGGTFSAGTYTAGDRTTATINTTTLTTQLATNNVVISTAGTGSSAGTLSWSAASAISWSANTSLTLTATTSLSLGSNITTTGSGGITFNAGTTITQTAGVAITTNGGAVAYNAATGMTLNSGTVTTAGGNITLINSTSGNIAGTGALNAGTGAISVAHNGATGTTSIGGLTSTRTTGNAITLTTAGSGLLTSNAMTATGGGAISVTSAANYTSAGAVSLGAGNWTVNAATGITVSGTVVKDTGAASQINLTNSGNASDITISNRISAGSVANSSNNSLTLTATSGRDVLISTSGALTASFVSGTSAANTLTANLSGRDITFNGATNTVQIVDTGATSTITVNANATRNISMAKGVANAAATTGPSSASPGTASDRSVINLNFKADGNITFTAGSIAGAGLWNSSAADLRSPVNVDFRAGGGTGAVGDAISVTTTSGNAFDTRGGSISFQTLTTGPVGSGTTSGGNITTLGTLITNGIIATGGGDVTMTSAVGSISLGSQLNTSQGSTATNNLDTAQVNLTSATSLTTNNFAAITTSGGTSSTLSQFGASGSLVSFAAQNGALTLGNQTLTLQAGSFTGSATDTITTSGTFSTAGGAVSLTSTRNGAANAITTNAAINTANGNVTLTASGTSAGMSINAINAVTGTITLDARGAVSQTGAFVSSAGAGGGIRLLGAGASYDLTTQANGLSGSATLAGNTGSIAYAQANAFSVGTVSGTVGITTTGATLLNATSGGTTITQSQAITAGGLLATAAGGVTLTNTSNNITGNVALTSTNTAISFVNTGNFNIGSVTGVGNITTTSGISSGSGVTTLTSTGTVTQTNGSNITNTGGLLLLGTGGNYQLTSTGNAIDTLAANTGRVAYTDTNSFTINTVGATNGITTSATSASLTDYTVALKTNTADSLLTITATTGNITTGGNGNVQILSDRLALSGNIVATGRVVEITTTSTGRAIDFGTSTGTPAEAGGGGKLVLDATETDNVTADTLRIGDTGSGNLTVGGTALFPNITTLALATAGTATEGNNTGAISVQGGAGNLVIRGAGNINLDTANNQVANIAISSSGGNVKFRDDNGFALSNLDGLTTSVVSPGGLLSLVTGSGTVTQNHALVADNLSLSGTSSGTFTLTNASNDFINVAASNSGGTISLRDTSGFAIGTVNGLTGFNVGSGGTATLTAGGAVTQSQIITAGTLTLNGTGGAYTLTSNNQIGSVAGNTGSIDLQNTLAAGLTINDVTVATTAKITSNAAGNLVIGSNKTITSSASSGDSVILGTNANFVASSGASIAPGSGTARYLIFTNNTGSNTEWDNTVRGSLTAGNFYNANFDVASARSAAVGSPNLVSTVAGNLFVYADRPTLTYTITPSASVVYNGTVQNLPSSYTSGLVNSDLIGTAATGAAGSTGVTSKNVATYTGVTGTIGSLASPINYAFAFTGTGSLTVTQKALTLTGATAQNKIYDGTTTASVTGASISGGGGAGNVEVVDAGNVTLGALTATFDTKNVGTGKTVTVTGASLSGTEAGNYTVANPAGLTANITQRDLTLNAVASTKTYDRTTASTGTPTVSAATANTGLVSGDTITSTLTQVFDSRNASAVDGRTLSVVTAGLTIADAGNASVLGNYNIITNTALGTINKLNISATGLSGVNRVYDGTNVAGLTGTPTITASIISGDTVSLDGTASGTFASKNVGNAKAITVTGLSLSGTDAANYNFTQPTGITANVTPKALTVDAVADTKTYDRTTNSAQTVTAVGLVGGDTTSTLSQSFDSKNASAANGRTLTVNSFTINDGNSGNNYSVSSATALGTINQLNLTLTGLSANNKVYDGNTSAVLTGTPAFSSALATADNLSLDGTGVGTFNTKNVGSGKTVTVSGYSISGTEAANYNFSNPTGITADITVKTLTASLTGTVSKQYDQTTAATLVSGNYSLGGFVAGEGATVTKTSGTYNTKNVGTSKPVTVTLAGGDFTANGGTLLSNYTLPTMATGNVGTITVAPLTVSGLTGVDKTYDATTTASVTGTAVLSGLFSGDDVTLGGSPTFAFATAGAGTAKTITASGYSVSGTDATNYSFTQPGGLFADIFKAMLSVSLIGSTSKQYNQTTAATLTTDNYSLTGFVGGEGAGSTVTKTSATYDTKNVGTGKTVTATLVSGDYSLAGGALAANYTLPGMATGAIGTITKAPLTVSGLTGSNKIYDATTAASFTGSAALSGLFSGDDVTLGGTGSASFANKNVGNGKTITITGFTASTGADAGNYNFTQPTGLTGNITVRDVTLNAVADTKTYDRTTASAGVVTDTAADASTGLVGGDTITGRVQTFDSKNASAVNGRTLTVTSYTVNDGNGGANYNVLTNTALGTINKLNLTLTGLSANNKVYDGNTSAVLTGTPAFSSALATSDNLSLDGTGVGTFNNRNVGTGKAVTVTGYSISGAEATNYNFSNPTGITADITVKTLTVNAVSDTKTYDRTTNSAQTISAVGLVGGDTTTALSQSFDSKNASATNGRTLTVNSFTINDGNSGNNYSVSSATALGTINKASLTATGLSGVNRVYDGTTVAGLTGTASITASIGGDDVSLDGTATGQFASKNVGTAKAITVSGLSISGTDAANYNFTNPTGLSANVTVRDLTINAVTDTKTYDRTTTSANAPTVAGATMTTGLVAGDSITSTLSQVFDSKNASAVNGRTLSVVSPGSITIEDAGAASVVGNYNIITNTALGTINAKGLTLTGVSAQNKAYDGTTTATLTGGSLSGIVSGDTVTFTAGSGVFDTKNAGTGKTVTASNYILTGLDNANYSLSQPTGLSADITKLTLTVSLTGNVDKVYNATTAATLTSANYNLSGFIAGEGASVTETVGSYDTKNVGTSKLVTSASLEAGDFTANGGTLLANYVLPTVATGNVGKITQKALMITGATAQNKVYDGTTTATVTGASIAAGVEAGDDAQLTGGLTASFDTKNVGTGKTVTVTGAALTGTDGGNYTVSNPAGLTADITQKTLTASLIGATSKQYNQTTAATLTSANYSLSGFVLTESATVTETVGAFDTKNVGTGKTVTATLDSGDFSAGAGTLLSNYALPTMATGAIGEITVAPLTVSGVSGVNRVYDGTTTAGLSGTAALSGLFSGDDVTLGGTGSGTFASKNVGSAKAITVTGYTATGTDATNYSFTQPTGLSANVTAKTLTVNAVADTKTYDRTTASTATVLAVGLVGGDTTSTLSQTFDTKNAGTGKTLTVGSFTISDGNGGNNYSVSSATALGTINAKSLTITGVTAQNKVYDGNTNATLTGGSVAGGVISGDSVTLTTGGATGTFSDKNAANGKSVSASGYGITGADATNYVIGSQPTGLTANITPKSLTASLTGTTTKQYNQTTVASLIPGNYSLSGFVSGESASVTETVGAYDTKNVGTGKTVTATLDSGDFTAGGGTLLTNYALPTTATGAIGIITAAPLTVSGLSGVNRTYDGTTGAAISGTAALGGLFNGDAVTLTGTGSGTFADKNVANGKAIAVTGFSVTGGDATNYIFAQPTGLTANITRATLSVTAANKTKVYGDADPALTFTASGVQSGDTLGTVLTGALSRAAGENVAGSPYAITAGTLTTNSNYTLAYTPGSFTITKATLTVTSADQTKTFGDTDPALTFSATGFKFADTAGAVLSGALSRVAGEDAGTYGITQGSLVANANYNIAYFGGTLTIAQAGLSAIFYSIGNTTNVYGTLPTIGTVVLTGVRGGDTLTPVVTVKNNQNQAVTLATTTGVGTYTASVTGITGANAANYFINDSGSTAGLITVTPAPLVITLSGVNKVYGDADPTLAFGVSGLVNGESVATALTGAPTRVAGENAGTYAVSRGSLAATSNYSVGTVNGGSLTITPAALVVTADNKSKTYGGTDPALTFAASGFKFADTAGTVLTGALSRGVGENAGTYAIGQGSLVASGNYSLTYNAATFTINRAPLVLNINSMSKVYGDADPALGYGVTGLVNGETLATAVTGAPIRAAGENASAYAIAQGTLAPTSNYTFATINSGTLTITPAPLSVTGTGQKTYGDADPVLTVNSSGYKFADTAASVLTGALTRTSGENAGTYNVLQGTLVANANYAIVFTPGVFTINPAGVGFSLSYAVANTTNVYGTLPTIGAVTLTGVQGGDNVSLVLAVRDSQNQDVTLAPTTGVGTYNVLATGLAGASAGNYVLNTAGSTQGLITVTPAPLVITLDNASKVYGTANDPVFGFHVTGLVNGESAATVLTGAPGRDPGQNAGTYAIRQGTIAANPNYAVSTVNNGTLTINRAPLAVTGSGSKTFGQPDPVLTVAATGFKFADTAATVLTGALSRASGENAGNYTITLGSLRANTNYNLNFTPGTFVINPAQLGFSINYDIANTTNVYGTLPTVGAVTLTGVQGNDIVTPVITVTNAQNAPITLARTTGVGTYTASVTGLSGANAGNYTIAGSDNVNGLITVTPAPLTITLANLVKTYGDADPTLSYGVAGLVNGETAAVALTGAPTRAAGQNAGNYAVTRGTLAATSNYSVANVVTGHLTINKATLTVSANAASKTFGDTDPTLTTTATGFKFADTASTVLSGAVARASGENAGTYDILQGTLTANSNYNIAFTPGVFTIVPKGVGFSVTYSVANTTNVYGTLPTVGTVTLTGVRNGDTVAPVVAVSDAQNHSVTLATTTNVGTYSAAVTGLSGADAGNYVLTNTGSTAGLITVTPAPLVITLAGATKVYGDVDPSLAFSATGLVNGETMAVALTGAPTRDAGENAGNYAVTQGTLAATSNYSVATVNAGTLSITPAVLSVSANAASITYGQADPALTFNASGFKFADTVTSVLTGSLARAAGVNAGTYAITQGTIASNPNYTLDFTGNTLTINRAPLNVTLASLTKVYGDSDPTIGVSATGLVNGDTLATALTGAPARVAGENAGSYTIGAGTLAPTSNYELATVGTGSLTITPAVLTVTGSGSKKFGEADPVIAVTSSGYKFADTQTSVLTGALSRAAGENAGTYAITPGTLAANPNYTISFVPGSFVINPATVTLTYTVGDTTNVYGNLPTIGTTTFAGVAEGDQLTPVYTVTNSQGRVVSLATNTGVGRYTASVTGLSGASAGNYVLADSGNVNGTITVTPATLTLTPLSVQKTYGSSDPTPTFNVAGLVGGDTGTVLSGTLGRTAGENVGNYGFTLGNVSAGANYVLALSPAAGLFSITPKAITYSIADSSSTYGTRASIGAVTLTGVLLNDSVSGVTAVRNAAGQAVTLAANTPAAVYTTLLTGLTGASAGNYVLAATGNSPGLLTVNKATLNLAVASVGKSFGAPNPALTYTADGFVAGDTAAALISTTASDAGSNKLAITTTAATDSPAGDYPITVSGQLANYNVVATPGTLTIAQPIMPQVPVAPGTSGGSISSTGLNFTNGNASLSALVTDPGNAGVSGGLATGTVGSGSGTVALASGTSSSSGTESTPAGAAGSNSDPGATGVILDHTDANKAFAVYIEVALSKPDQAAAPAINGSGSTDLQIGNNVAADLVATSSFDPTPANDTGLARNGAPSGQDGDEQRRRVVAGGQPTSGRR